MTPFLNYCTQRAAIAAGQQGQSATNDAIATGVAIIVFFPAAFLIHGNGVNAQELAELKGDMEAIQQANIQKNCGIQFQQSPAPTQ
jgi:acid phosphatase family membrane protein YuiD